MESKSLHSREISLEKMQKKIKTNERKLEMLLKAKSERETNKPDKNLLSDSFKRDTPSNFSKEISNTEAERSAENSGTKSSLLLPKSLQLLSYKQKLDELRSDKNQGLLSGAPKPNIAQALSAYKSLARAGNARILQSISSTNKSKGLEMTFR